MNLKKILSGALIGAFAFGIGASGIQSASAASLGDTKKITDAKDKFESVRDKFNGARNSDSTNPPEPPKDENGNPLPPPDRNSDDTNRPEPPKDENGNPLPPPNKNSGSSTLDDLKDKANQARDAKEKYDKTKKKIDDAKRIKSVTDKLK